LLRRQALAGGDAQHNASVDFAKLQSFAWAFYKFTRPHTMAGTTISIISMSALAFQQLGGAWSIAALASALTSALLMNITIVGINQLADIEIDKVS
jgi:homogentisate phytyltransferase/homogentisate geranylgeranyltransferase